MTVCDPTVTVAAGAFLALAVFVGGLLAAGALELLRRIKYHRARRITLLHTRILGRRP